MTIDLEKLETLAKAATPGPWAVDEECLADRGRLYVAKGSPGNLRGRILEVFMNCLVRDEGRARNAAIIAAANPAAILELCAEVRRLRESVDKLLAHCPDPECFTCGEAVCPHGEPLHFHHDGCPSCCEAV
jgi:hypothetical protein